MGKCAPQEVGGDHLSSLGGQVNSELLPTLSGPKGIQPLIETGTKAHLLDFGSVSQQIALTWICLLNINFFYIPFPLATVSLFSLLLSLFLFCFVTYYYY